MTPRPRWAPHYSLEQFRRPIDCLYKVNDGLSYTPHFHNGVELLYCEAGKGWFQFAERRFPYFGSVLLLFNGSVPHSVNVKGVYKRWNMWLEPTVLGRSAKADSPLLATQTISNTGIAVAYVPDHYHERLKELFETISFEIERQQPNLEQVIYYRLQELAIIITRLSSSQFESEPGRAREMHGSAAGINDPLDLISYIEANLSENLSAASLSERFHYSEHYFYRRIRRLTGLSLNEYVKRRRIQRAKDLLRATDLTVTEIAELVGIPDISQFSRTFRASTGVAPSQYRWLER